MLDIDSCQAFMNDQGIDAWVAFDFRGSNPVFWHLIGGTRSTTRRAFLVIPASGLPRLLCHVVDRDAFRSVSVDTSHFRSWSEMHELLRVLLQGAHRVAMEDSPRGSIPTVSWVDAGTVELLRSWDLDVVSSAELFQIAAASWDEQALRSHIEVGPIVAGIKDAAFSYIADKVRAKESVTEHQVVGFIMERFAEAGLETQDAPVVAVNANSGDPHYEATAEASAVIRKGDWILIDLWARFPGQRNVFSDITWVAYAGSEAPERHRHVFETVRDARDAGVDFLKSAWREGRTLMGCEVDAVVRARICQAGYGHAFVHRTGHSIGPGARVHALGVNIDDFETHDTRSIRPRVGFTIEPGIYLPEFGVRLEINVYLDPDAGPTVTSPIQRDIVLLG